MRCKVMPTPSSPPRLQLPAPRQLAEDFIVPGPARYLNVPKIGHSIKDASSPDALRSGSRVHSRSRLVAALPGALSVLLGLSADRGSRPAQLRYIASTLLLDIRLPASSSASRSRGTDDRHAL